MRNEDRFPTVRFRTCTACGHVYTGSLTGQDACPKCHAAYREKTPAEAGIAREDEGGHVLFSIRGTLLSMGQLEGLRALIDAAFRTDARSIAFAFENSSFLSSSLINLLVKTMRTLSIQGRPIFIITSDAEVLESLQTMDLDRVMRILPDRESYRTVLA